MSSIEENKAFTPFCISTPSPLGGEVVFYRPDISTIEKTKKIAQNIFVEAFQTTYLGYYQHSKSTLSIEEWLRLKPGVHLIDWLNATFEEEYSEWLSGDKGVIFLQIEDDPMMAWVSHGQVSASGELYMSQCCLAEKWRRKGIPTAIFLNLLKQPNLLLEIFPGVKEAKLITRKINEAANRLYTNAGLIRDEQMDPSVYGDAYDERYVGYRLKLVPARDSEAL